MAIDMYVQQVTQKWNALGYDSHHIELWEMLCGYLDIHGGRTEIGLLPNVLHPVMLAEPHAQAVRQWFSERNALPVEEWDRGRVGLLPDWRERLERMQDLHWEGVATVEAWLYGYLPWYYHLDFPDEDALCQADA